MILSNDARRLWDAACRMNRLALDRAGADVRGTDAVGSRPPGLRQDLPPLLLFTDPERVSRPWDIVKGLPEGAGVVYRHFGHPDAEATARRLRRDTLERGVVLLIGLDAGLADRVGADGVHLPERALSAAYALGGRRPDWLLTGAAHSAQAAQAARDLHAVVVSPVFPAGGASGARPPLGVETFAAITGSAACPVYALGGIGPDTVEALANSGACGVAGVAAFARGVRPGP